MKLGLICGLVFWGGTLAAAPARIRHVAYDPRTIAAPERVIVLHTLPPHALVCAAMLDGRTFCQPAHAFRVWLRSR